MTGTILAGNDTFLYGLVLTLHILAAIAGFGPTFAYPVFAAMARRRSPAESLAINETTFEIAQRFEMAIYAVPVFGILLVFLSDETFEFSDPWIGIAIVLYVIAVGVSRGLHAPNLRRMNELEAELVRMGPGAAGPPAGGTPPQVAELEERGKRAGMYGGILHLLLLVILVDMIWKPGWP